MKQAGSATTANVVHHLTPKSAFKFPERLQIQPCTESKVLDIITIPREKQTLQLKKKIFTYILFLSYKQMYQTQSTYVLNSMY